MAAELCSKRQCFDVIDTEQRLFFSPLVMSDPMTAENQVPSETKSEEVVTEQNDAVVQSAEEGTKKSIAIGSQRDVANVALAPSKPIVVQRAEQNRLGLVACQIETVM